MDNQKNWNWDTLIRHKVEERAADEERRLREYIEQQAFYLNSLEAAGEEHFNQSTHLSELHFQDRVYTLVNLIECCVVKLYL